jgi:hypothetical protein
MNTLRPTVAPGAPTTEQLLAALADGPTRIAQATAAADPVALRTRPGPDEWSANEVLAHLRACADVWGACVDTILAEDEPTIRAVNPRRWSESTDYVEQPFADSLRAFTRQRRKLLDVLGRLAPADWSRSATVTGAGRPAKRSVHDYARRLADHERPHVKQIRQAIESPDP